MKLKTTLLAAALLLMAQAASAVPFSYDCTDCPLAIPPSGSSGTTISTISVGDSGTIADLSLFVDATHTFSGDLEISLAHAATSVLLQDNIGGSANYVPTNYGVLAAFAGMDIFGDWILTINDTLGGDVGTLRDWTISGNRSVDSVPVPATLALMGLGLMGLSLSRRKKV